MIIDEITILPEYKLSKIINTLRNVYGVNINLNENCHELLEKSLNNRKAIIMSEKFNTYHLNNEYNKELMISEALKLYLTEIAPKRLGRKKKKGASK